MTGALVGRVAMVTGAGRGVGRAIAVGLARAGAGVALLARSAGELEETAALVREAGAAALPVPADVADPVQVASALERAVSELGVVDVLVNNAAVVWPLGPSTRVELGAWADALEVNVVAVARITFALLPDMLARGWGRVVDVSSGVVASPGSMLGANAYATSKAALEAHALNLAAELDGTGVTVNVYRPGRVDTAMQGWIREQDPAAIGAELHERFTRWHAEGELISPEQSAAALLARIAGEESGRIWDAALPLGELR